MPVVIASQAVGAGHTTLRPVAASLELGANLANDTSQNFLYDLLLPETRCVPRATFQAFGDEDAPGCGASATNRMQACLKLCGIHVQLGHRGNVEELRERP